MPAGEAFRAAATLPPPCLVPQQGPGVGRNHTPPPACPLRSVRRAGAVRGPVRACRLYGLAAAAHGGHRRRGARREHGEMLATPNPERRARRPFPPPRWPPIEGPVSRRLSAPGKARYPWPMSRAARSALSPSSPVWSPRFGVLAALLACAPSVNRRPLGLGPLALAEREARAQGSPQTGASRSGGLDAFAAAGARAEPSQPAEPEEAEGEEGGVADGGSAAELEGDAEDSQRGAEGNGAPAEFTQFAGMFEGSDVAIFRFEGAGEQRQEDPNARIRVELDTPPRLRFVLINSDNGEDLCTLEASLEDGEAKFEGAQPCFTEDDSNGLTAVVTEGRADLRGDRLRLRATGTLEAVTEARTVTGELSYQFRGQRE